MSATATQAAPPRPAAPPAPPEAPAPEGPFAERDLARRDLLAGVEIKADQYGISVTLHTPHADGDWVQRQRAEGRDLERPLHAAREQALASADCVEYRRRAKALRSAEGQRRYYEAVRIPELRAARKRALAEGDDAALAQAELNMAQAEAELKKFTERTAALAPLTAEAQRLAAATLKAAVGAAHRGAHGAAIDEARACKQRFVEAVLQALAPLMAAEVRRDYVAQPATRDRLGELPAADEKQGG
jgi:hypothetical protein